MVVRTAKCKDFEQLVGEKVGENYSLIGVRRRNSLDSYLEIGGGEEIRTPDPLLAKQVLSRLSYTPKSFDS